MSTEDSNSLEIPETIIRCESPPPVAPLKHQHSFEQRYAALINQQILENTINREVLKRQVESFFPFSRSASKERQEENKVPAKDSNSEDSEEENEKEEEQQQTDMDVKVLQKLETLDIADKEQT